MGSFNSTILTQKAHNLMAKSLGNTAEIQFTKIRSSDHDYSVLNSQELEALTEIEDIKQEISVSEVKIMNDAAVKVHGVILNTELTQGYYIKTIALYAEDPDEGEILYSITVATLFDWMPPYNGLASSSALVNLITVISNAENVSINVDPSAIVSITMFNEFKDQVNSQMSEIPQQTYITEKAKTVDVNNALALKADQSALNTTNLNITTNTNNISNLQTTLNGYLSHYKGYYTLSSSLPSSNVNAGDYAYVGTTMNAVAVYTYNGTSWTNSGQTVDLSSTNFNATDYAKSFDMNGLDTIDSTITGNKFIFIP